MSVMSSLKRKLDTEKVTKARIYLEQHKPEFIRQAEKRYDRNTQRALKRINNDQGVAVDNGDGTWSA